VAIAIVPPVAITAVGLGPAGAWLSWFALVICSAAANGSRWQASLCCPSVSENLWEASAAQLLLRTASADPTPGGGAIAAVVAAFGVGLVQMALRVTLAGTSGTATAELKQADTRAGQLRELFTRAAEEDTRAFDALMEAYRMPRESEADQAARHAAIGAATLSATRTPLALARAVADAVALADAVAPLVKASITSDVLAGRDLLRGAGLAALRTAEINLPALAASGQAEAVELRAEHGSLLAQLDAGGALP
jgi:formiminotetrahydrofolate cyclodeaminase